MRTKKAFWKSKTFWFGLLVAIIPFIEKVQQLIVDLAGGDGGLVVTALGVLIVILRFVTKEAVGTSDKTT